MATQLKRSATFVGASGDEPAAKRVTFARCDTVIAEPPAVARIPPKIPYIVVVKHEYPAETKMNDAKDFNGRGRGNTFTLEVVAASPDEAICAVENMLGIEFDCTATMDVLSVCEAPGRHWGDAEGNTVTVLSSRYAVLRDGATAYDEIVSAAKDEVKIQEREAERGPRTVVCPTHMCQLEFEVEQAVWERERYGCCEADWSQ